MGRNSKVIDLTEAERTALEKGYRNIKAPIFSRRCHYILLKSQGKTSEEIADIFGVTRQPVDRWCNAYLEKGLLGLKTKSGQGRKPILDKLKDEAVIKETVKKERQRLKKAKEILENELDKSFSLKTLQRFLKTLAADGSE